MKGISPIISIVFLVAIVTLAGVGVYFWVSGAVTEQSTPPTPIVISAIAIDADPSHLRTIIANLGRSTIEAGTVFFTANGANTTLAEDLPPGGQVELEFLGGSDDNGTISFNETVTIYTNKTGSAIIFPITPPLNITQPSEVTSDSGDEVGGAFAQDSNGLYWMFWAENGVVYLMNSTTPNGWDDSTNMSVDASLGSDQDPQIYLEGGTVHLVWALRGAVLGDDFEIKYKNYTASGFGDLIDVASNKNGDTIEPSLVKGTDGMLRVLYTLAIGARDIYQTNSSDGGNWATVVEVVNAPTTPLGNPSIIQAADGTYWFTYKEVLFDAVRMFNSSDPGIGWNATNTVDSIGGSITRYTKTLIMQDSDGDFLVAFSQGQGEADCGGGSKNRAYVVKSPTGYSDWSIKSRITNESASSNIDEIVNGIFQNSDGTYWLSYTRCGTGINTDIFVRSSNDALIWR